MVMWLLLVLGMLVLTLTRSASVNASLSRGEVERVQAAWLARAGVEQALAVLADDTTLHDGPGDVWYDDAGRFDNVALADGHTFRVTAPPQETSEDPTLPRFGLDDLASRVPINAAQRNQLRNLPDITPAQVDALLDWIDTNESARAGGAERGYYYELDFPYLIRNGPFRTHREMLLVRGIERETFFGEDENLNGTLERNENDGDLSPPGDDQDRQLQPGLARYTTVHSYDPNTTLGGLPRINPKTTPADTLATSLSLTPSLAEAIKEEAEDADDLFDFLNLRGDGSDRDPNLTDQVTLEWLAGAWETLTLEDDQRLPGKINVNTASRVVLETVPGMRPEMADAIIGQRASQGDFATLGELHSRNTLNDRQFQRVAASLTVRSNVFRVLSQGQTPSGTRARLEVLIDRGGTQPVILDWRQP